MATDLRLELRLKIFDLDLSSLRKDGATQGRGKHEHDPAQTRVLGGIGRGGVGVRQQGRGAGGVHNAAHDITCLSSARSLNDNDMISTAKRPHADAAVGGWRVALPGDEGRQR